MQFTRNRRILLVQDIVLISLIPLLCLFTLGAIRIGKWNVGNTFLFDPASSEVSELCLSDFYDSYINSDGNELDDTVAFSPLGIWKTAAEGIGGLFEGMTDGTIDLDNLRKMPDYLFDDCAGLLFMVHVVTYTFSSTVYQGLLYAALFGITAAMPVICIVQAVYALIRFFMERDDLRKRHRSTVLCFRRAALPLFVVLALAVMLPDVTLSSVWFYGMGLYLLCVIWNLVASRVKRNTGNEKEFLNFIQISSVVGTVLALGALAALKLSHIPAYLFDRIRYADGIEIISNCFEGDFDVPKLLMLIFIAVFLVGLGTVIRYLYYSLLRIACIMESTRHKKVETEGMVGLTVFALLSLASSFFLFGASGRLKLMVEESEKIAFFVSMGLLLLVLILEAVQRALCYLNRLDREYRNDLLCGRTDDRMYSVDAVIAETAEPAAAEDPSVEQAPMEEPSAETAPADESLAETAPAEELLAEGFDE